MSAATVAVSVRVGLNIGTVPIGNVERAAIVGAVRGALESAGGFVVTCGVAAGGGSWTHDDGTHVVEDCLVVDAVDVLVGELPAVRAACAAIAGTFRQDAVALWTGSELIPAP
jgi:hypothetical protein